MAGGVVKLELTHALPDEALPADKDLIKYLKIPSRLLSDFHGRPMALRVGVILPRDFDRHPEQRYPIRVHIGGYGSRFTEVGNMMTPGSRFHRAWMAEDAPRMVLIHLDGAGPLGDPYQIDSANHGPYGAAITRELIPMIEKKFQGIGDGQARVVDGGSTGGWVALALQIFYPDFFNGAWAFCPDSVDFRSFQLVNIYDDENAYINRHGFERPAARDGGGDVRYTMRHECQLENVLGNRDSWSLSGGQWGDVERDLRAQSCRRPTRSALEPDNGSHRPQGGWPTGKATISAATSRKTGQRWAPSSEASSTSGLARPTIFSSTTPFTGSIHSCRTLALPTRAPLHTAPDRDTAGWEFPRPS